MKFLKRRPLLAAWAAVLCLIFGACTFIQNDNTNDNDNDITSPSSPTPTPSPSASPSAGPSDVDSLAIFVYGYQCATGVEPSHSAGIITSNCTEANLTATPKRANGDDATSHSTSITWQVDGASFEGQVVPGPEELLFNRTVKAVDANGRRRPGTVTLTATLKEGAREFRATKVIVIQ